MTSESEKEFQELLAYVGYFATEIWGVDPESDTHPARSIEATLRQFGEPMALIGLRQAANDTLEETLRWNVDARAFVDEAFRAGGVVTVSEIARRYSASYKRVLKRGQIRDETEYYVINAVLIDQGDGISAGERTQLQSLIDMYDAHL